MWTNILKPLCSWQMAKMKGEDFLMQASSHVMRVTTLSELKVSSFLASSSISQATDFFRPQRKLWSWAQHASQSSTLVNALWREMSLFCFQLPRHCGGFWWSHTTDPAHSLAHGLCTKHPCSAKDLAETPAHSWCLPGGLCSPLKC